jgi:hypothetical protein
MHEFFENITSGNIRKRRGGEGGCETESSERIQNKITAISIFFKLLQSFPGVQ